MRYILLIMGLMMVSFISAQEKKNSVSRNKEVCADTVRIEQPGADKYAVVYKDGLCGLYDLDNKKNVTEIRYTTIKLRNRTDSELGPICVFVFTEGKSKGLLSIFEENNEAVSVYL